jgi:hypothetical protein
MRAKKKSRFQLTESDRFALRVLAVIWLESGEHPPEVHEKVMDIFDLLLGEDVDYLMSAQSRGPNESHEEYVRRLFAWESIQAYSRSEIGEFKGLEGLDDDAWWEEIERRLDGLEEPPGGADTEYLKEFTRRLEGLEGLEGLEAP